VVNYLKAVGIRMQLRPLERAAFFAQYREKKLRNLIQAGSAAFGNAAKRIEAFVADGGAEPDRKKREAILVKLQQLMHEKVMSAPIWELGFLIGVGPRVSESGLGLITGHAYSAPYEDLKLKTP
jgi:peptide/nickel transport system substrate-binding protein